MCVGMQRVAGLEALDHMVLGAKRSQYRAGAQWYRRQSCYRRQSWVLETQQGPSNQRLG